MMIQDARHMRNHLLREVLSLPMHLVYDSSTYDAGHDRLL